MNLTYGSVCSGIEAASVAWEPIGMKPLWFSEIEPFPSAVLAAHWPQVDNLGDMTKLAAAVRVGDVPAPDLLVGGTPCQAFSVAGLRGGLSDERGQLTLSYVELADSIDEKREQNGEQPAIIVWENVPGVLSSKDNAFGCFLAGLAGESEELKPTGEKWTNVGYVSGPKRTIAWRILDAQYFGVAQRRRRVFVVASARTDICPAEILFEYDSLRGDITPGGEAGQTVAALTKNGVGATGADDNQARAGHLIAFGGGNTSGEIKVATTCTAHGARLDFDTDTFAVHGTQDPDVNHELAHTLGRNYGQENACIAFSCKDYGADATENLSPTLRAGNSSNSNQNSGQPPAVVSFQERGRDGGRNLEISGELAYALTSPAGGGRGQERNIADFNTMAVRRLTPVECERLQGFPDNHTLISWRGKDAADCPDGPRYRAIGNSMAVPVMRWIGERILAALLVQQMANQPEVTKTNDKPERTGIPMSYQLIGGRCEHALKNLPDNSVDSIVTDPPYGIGFMSNKWDYAVPTVEQWAECLRVLKPGGHLLAFGGSRTYHRLVVNIEDAGFEIRDQIMWIYGSGFPKSKNLDGEHKGKGTALKPAHEPIVMARKPFSTTILNNVTEYGTGALNIDLCRVPADEMLAGGSGGLLSDVRDGKAPAGNEWAQNNEGRWPANIIHDGSDEVIAAFPDAKGQQGKVRNDGSDNGNKVFGKLKNVVSNPEPRTESATSAARFFYCAKVSKSDRDAGMDRFIVASASEMTGGRAEGSVGINNPRAGAGRTSGAKNTHPTVKPVDLMRYLCRLVTPAGGTVLDPFMGSGSTGKAAITEGFRFIGIEMDPDHLVTAAARIGHAVKEIEKTGEVA